MHEYMSNTNAIFDMTLSGHDVRKLKTSQKTPLSADDQVRQA